MQFPIRAELVVAVRGLAGRCFFSHRKDVRLDFSNTPYDHLTTKLFFTLSKYKMHFEKDVSQTERDENRI